MVFYLKKFFNSTILGVSLGVVLVAYGVFAFDPPTVDPPGENAEMPLNVGTEEQEKLGNLLINSLGVMENLTTGGDLIVDGSIEAGGILNLQGNRITNVGTPTVTGDVATKKYVDEIAAILRTDNDHDRVPGLGIYNELPGFSGEIDCDDTDINVWQIMLGFPDGDEDGHFTENPIPENVCSGDQLLVGYSDAVGDDCNDSCPTCFPGSTATTLSADGLDQDCDGTADETSAGNSKTCTVNLTSRQALETACNAYCEGSNSVSASCSPRQNIYSAFNWGGCQQLSYDAQGYDQQCNGSVTCSCRTLYH